MEATSSSMSKRNINRGIIKFKNWKCSCGIKAGVRISEFWEPTNEEFNLSEYTKSITQRYDRRDRYDSRDNLLLEQDMEDVKTRLQRLERYYARMENQDTSDHGRMHQLESMQGGSRVMCVVNMFVLGVTIAVLVVITNNNH
ncbi:hypothetical protein Q3G72_029446 [Acer saccharum]|nr:hypothetical protein Q3G72_029446 [Acer saccharum]